MKKFSIYKLICSQTNRVYIGSTGRPLYKRKWNHNSKTNFTCSRDFINPTIDLIEEIETDDINIVLNKEKYIIKLCKKINPNLIVNKNLPNRKADEYYVDNHSIILLKKKAYYELNKDKIKLDRLLHYYRNHNIEDIKNKKVKEIFLERKEIELKKTQLHRLKQKVLCNQCNSFVSYRHVSRHNRTKKHLLQSLSSNASH
tara:strand:+ start:430 stop:1029 length:600 start_codon:yes stop_codon:yes gene_type:complete